MTDLKWFEEYSGQTTDELISLQGEFRTDSIVLAFEEALYQKYERLGKGNLSNEELIVLAVEALEREVNNGGYEQFFYNSSNEYASMIVNALKQIGCNETAQITQRAIDCLEINGPINPESIDMVLEVENEEREAELTECDNLYYEIAGDLADPLLEFIKNNQHKITLHE